MEDEPEMKDWKMTSKFKHLPAHAIFKKRVGFEWYSVFPDVKSPQGIRISHKVLKGGKFVYECATFEELPQELKTEVLVWKMSRQS